MLNRAINYFKSQPPAKILFCATVGLIVVGCVDLWAGPDIRLSIFSLIPLVLTAYFAGPRAGMVMAVLTAAMWLALDLMGFKHYSHLSYAYANTIVRLMFFAFAIWAVSTWKQIGQRLEKLVEVRTAELSAQVRERVLAEESLHKLAMELADVEDAERRKLAHDIHDAVGQNLTVMKLRLEAASVENDVQRQRVAMGECLSLLNSLIGQTRNLTFELHPPMLDDLGLVAALNWFAKTFAAQTHCDVTISEYGQSIKLPLSISSYLFRAIKELAANAVKHGRASEVVVSVYWRPGSVRVVVDDNGSGFDPAIVLAGKTQGLGLPGIRERATTLGGTLELESEVGAGKGTRAIVQVPCEGYDSSSASSSKAIAPAVAVA